MDETGADAATSTEPSAIVRPSFVSSDVWEVVELAAKLNGVSLKSYIENALLDEAIILEQERLGYSWQVRTREGRVGEVSFR